MAIEAVISYWKSAGVTEEDDVSRVVARAAAAGFSFTADEHRTTLAVRGLLVRLNRDRALREALLTAETPIGALLEHARDAGYDLNEEAVRAVIRALRHRHGELDSAELDNVAGGVAFLPEVDDEVIVAFDQGDVRKPVTVGSLWGSKDKPPTGR